MKEAGSVFQPLKRGEPGNITKTLRKRPEKTLARVQQLKANRGKWFVYVEGRKTAAGTAQILCSLTGLPSVVGLNRKKLPFQCVSRMQADGTYTYFVRYVGKNGVEA